VKQKKGGREREKSYTCRQPTYLAFLILRPSLVHLIVHQIVHIIREGRREREMRRKRDIEEEGDKEGGREIERERERERESKTEKEKEREKEGKRERNRTPVDIRHTCYSSSTVHTNILTFLSAFDLMYIFCLTMLFIAASGGRPRFTQHPHLLRHLETKE
jgi:hypothetical protein